MGKNQVGGFVAPTNNEINSTNNRSATEAITNISDKTLDVLKDIAVSNDMVIITRPVNSVAFVHMKAGAVGKNMFVHGKSAASGTIAQGLIPMLSSISKAGADDNVDKIATYNNENTHSIEASHHKFKEIEDKLKAIVENRNKKSLPMLKPQELLKEAGVPQEAFDPLVSKVGLLDKNGNQLYIFEDNKGRALRAENRDYIYAIKEKDTFKLVDINHNIIDPNPKIPANFKPKEIEVIGKPEMEIGNDGSLTIRKVLPITADIDVLAYGAKINLQEFDKIESYSTIIKTEKTKIIEESGLSLPNNLKTALVNKEIDQVLTEDKNTMIKNLPPYVINGSVFKKLISNLQRLDTNREHLRGMGEGSEAIMAITGHMRAEFRDKAEISHGAEQFNIHFTQPMDKEWVKIDNTGKVGVVKGEIELIKTFNKFKNEGLSIPPNPNWGWKCEEGQYSIDQDLRKLHEKAGDLTLQLSGANHYQKKEINGILNLKTKLGIESIKDSRNEDLIHKMKNDLSAKIEQYNEKYFEITAHKPKVKLEKFPHVAPELHLIKQQLAKFGLKDVKGLSSAGAAVNRSTQKADQGKGR